MTGRGGDGAAVDPDDVLVTIAHPHGDVEVPLADWVRLGPGPRPGVRVVSARRRSTGDPVPLTAFHDPWRPAPP